MAIGNIKRPEDSTSTAPAAQPRRTASRFAGVKSSKPQTPQPPVGRYRFEIAAFREGRSPVRYVFIDLIVREIFRDGTGVQVGDTVTCMQNIVSDAGVSRVKAAFVAGAGFDRDADYDEFDPNGDFIDFMFGHETAYCDLPDEERTTLIGRYVDADVRRGKDTPDGDYFRDWDWKPVADEDQAQ